MKYNFFLVLFFIFSGSASATEWVNAEHIKGRIVAEQDRFGIELETEKNWHTYYKDPGDAGIPTSFDWKNSKDITVHEVMYPEHQEFDEYGIKTKGYEGNMFFPVDADFGANPVADVVVSGAVCHDICIPYTLNLRGELPQYGSNAKPVIAESSKENISKPYGIILWTAFLAGLVLNIMPCVLPVLSLKVLGVVKQSGVEKRRARFNFLATSFGIIFSFWVLAALAISVKEAGMAVGWGLHFQSPIFVGVLLAVILLFAASLFGLFHLRPPSWIAGGGSHNTIMGNFFSGVLATLLGTSCTAPILVTAVGFALSGTDADIFIVFTVMGVGMALPFLAFAFRPQLANFLPKPGAWMVRVKYLMGVLLLATAAWLGYVLYTQLANVETHESKKSIKEWEAFDEASIPGYIASGKTVFVDITASWCVNCKVNKRAVLETDEMNKFFAREDIVLMRGDMTRPSKVLVEYIKKYNRYGIPFNIVYGPNSKDGVLLPALLSKDGVKEAVAKASGR